MRSHRIHDAWKGGKTTQENGEGGCGFHNRWKYHHPDRSDEGDDADEPGPFG